MVRKLANKLQEAIHINSLSHSSIELVKSLLLRNDGEIYNKYNEVLLQTEHLLLLDFKIVYESTSVVFEEGRAAPYLSVRVDLNHPSNDLTRFIFTLHYGLEGELYDYFFEQL